MFAFFKSLFGEKPPQLPALASMTPAAPRREDSRELHWPAVGMFPVTAAGVSYHLEALAKLAGNPPGKPALVFCTARLDPEPSNPNDANAVAVWIAGEKVGCLPREYTTHFRGLFAKFGLTVEPTTCDAVISNGLLVEGKQYSYTIELDIAGDVAPTSSTPSYPHLSRENTDPVFQRQDDGSYLVTVRVVRANEVLGNMHKHRRMGSWTTGHWSTINYYVANPQGIGLGHKLFEISKPTHQEMFGTSEPHAEIVSIDGLSVTVRLPPAATSPPPACI